ncbi:MAG: sugar kinase [Methylobacteriaceae bacterium]|nr:sugar kinase [Methylobacteriaceae bacterium]
MRAPSARIVCLGLSALDVVWRVDSLFGGGSEKIRAGAHATLGGGMAATAAVAVARLGAKAAFWGRGGEDAAGEQMRAELATEGVEVKKFRLFPGGQSSVSGVIVGADGERQIVNFRGSFPEAADWLPLDEIARTSAVLADPSWVAGASALFTAARAANVPTILDADVAEPDVFDALLPLTDHAVFSTPALERFQPMPIGAALAKIASYGCRVAAVTRGAEGVSWREEGAAHEMRAQTVDAIDTTGAGDVFHGAYALAIGIGLNTSDAIAFAAGAAAIKCTRAGARAGIPSLADCLALRG